MAVYRTIVSFLFLTNLRISNGYGPIYANLRQEVDNLATKMKDRFEGINAVMEMFDVKLDILNASLSADTARINNSFNKMGSKLEHELNKSRDDLNRMGNHTGNQLDDIKGEIQTMQKDTTKVKEQLEKGQGDTRKILKAVNGLKEDYKDFTEKTNSLWSLQSNLSAIAQALDENERKVTREIAKLRGDFTTVIRDEILVVQTALASLLNDMASVKDKVKNIGFTAECPSGWTRFENSCYLIVSEKNTWKLAKFVCNQQGSFLTEMYTEKEIKFLATMSGNETSELWTGATIGRKGVWYWTESKSEVDLDLFNGKYPTGRSRAYCGRFLPKEKSLDDINCGKKCSFVCRKFSLEL